MPVEPEVKQIVLERARRFRECAEQCTRTPYDTLAHKAYRKAAAELEEVVRPLSDQDIDEIARELG